MTKKINNFLNSKYIYYVAFLWGLFESTFFFIIPDIFISFIVLFSFKKGTKVLFYTVLGALLGGSIMYFFGKYNIDLAVNFLEKIPLINEKMILFTKNELLEHGLLGMILGPTNGVPYKIYASLVGSLNYNYFLFLIYTIPARLSRFLLTFFISGIVGYFVRKKIKNSYIVLIILFILFWIFSYSTYYFTVLKLYY